VGGTPSGKGYWLVTSAGGVLAYGDAKVHGTGVPGSAPIVSLAPTPSGKGYWLAASDGRVAAYGDAPKLGSAQAPTAVLVRC
jgi:succinate dehydrogenase/fumarate reductase flavoprotein subunit